jgi:5-methylcytosine-specific restriction endonuclease McrA
MWEREVALSEPDDGTELLFDGKPVVITGWDEKNGQPVVDFIVDGITKWTYWPSPRFERGCIRCKVKITASGHLCGKCGRNV